MLKLFCGELPGPLPANKLPPPLPLFSPPAPNQSLSLAPEFGAYFTLTSAQNADIAMLPFRWDQLCTRGLEDLAFQFIQQLNQKGVKVLVFHNCDITLPPPAAGVFVYQPSLLHSTMNPAETAPTPVFFNNWPEPLPPCPFQSTPGLGFCGYSGIGVRDRAKQVLLRIGSVHPAGRERYQNLMLTVRPRELRRSILSHFRAIRSVSTDFVERTNFMGGAAPKGQSIPPIEKRVRQDFRENLARNQYGLAMRGAGNFSYRFYEILAAGRIPVFINTDCALPLENRIPWREHCVWIEGKHLEQGEQQLLEFHRRLGPEGLRKLQKKNRALYEDYLSVGGFFRHLKEDLTDRNVLSPRTKSESPPTMQTDAEGASRRCCLDGDATSPGSKRRHFE